MAPAVDEERRRAGDAAEVGAVDVLGDARGADAFAQVVGEAFDVETELLGVADQVVELERVLVLEQEVVHLPERALLGGGLGGLRGELSVGVDVVQRQVPPDVADVAEVAQELADDRLRLPAVGALEVAVLDDRDRRLERPADVVALGIDVDVEVDERLRRAEQRADPQRAGAAAPLRGTAAR